MLIFFLSAYVLAIYIVLSLFYIRTKSKDFQGKFIILGWITFVLPVLVLTISVIVRFLWM